jgi:hypothetical protein
MVLQTSAGAPFLRHPRVRLFVMRAGDELMQCLH